MEKKYVCEYRRVCPNFEHEGLKCSLIYQVCDTRADYIALQDERQKENAELERVINMGDIGLARHFTNVPSQ